MTKRRTLRSTVDLDHRRLREQMRLPCGKSNRETLHRATNERLRRARTGELLALEGKVEFAVGWREMEAQELATWHPRRR